MRFTINIIHGDCLEEMKKMENNSIDCIVTDPPYGLSFMGKKWDKEVPSVDYWIEMLRIAKPGSFLLAAGAPRSHHHLAIAIENAGWEITDCIMHLFGSGFPKGKSQLKPAYEPWILARKKADKVKFLNIDDCRIGIEERSYSGAIKLMEKRPWNEKQAERPIFNCTGRWPANLILGDEEVEAMLDEQSGVSKSTPSVRRNNYPSCNTLGVFKSKDIQVTLNDSGGASRFFFRVGKECFLCYNPLCKAKENECKNITVNYAESSFKTTPQTTESIALKNAVETQNEQFVQNVKSAENLCDLCVMNIVQGLVGIKNSDSKIEELQVTLDYIGNFKKCILIQNLVSFAELWGNIDTIPTTKSLSLLFGSVRHAIENYTKQEDLNLNGKNEKNRFLYCAKASKSERNKGCEGMPIIKCGVGALRDSGRGKTNENHHPTVKPQKLMEYLIKLVMPKHQGAVLLDPFMGSGSTLVACKTLGVEAIGIEMNAEYCEIARKRVEHIN